MAQIHHWMCLALVCLAGTISSVAQSSEELLDLRAKEMHSAITSSDEAVWRKFIETNYSSKMLEKYEMDRHLGLFKRLNKDFSDSQLVSNLVKDDKLHMDIKRNSDNHRVLITISYDKDENFKFNGFYIEAGEL